LAGGNGEGERWMRLSGRCFFNVVYVFSFFLHFPHHHHLHSYLCSVLFTEFFAGLFLLFVGFSIFGIGIAAVYFFVLCSFLCSYHYEVHGGQKEGRVDVMNVLYRMRNNSLM
jgi:predicted membrane protein